MKARPVKKKPTGIAAVPRRVVKKLQHKAIVWWTRLLRVLPSAAVPERPPVREEPLPLVSVGFPVYNGAERFPKALDALLAQTYPNIEIIISDNCSTDGTGAIAESYSERHSHIRFYRNSRNIGAAMNFQRTLDLAQGEYFMWAADDDLWEPTFVEKIMEGLLSDPEYVTDFCYLDKFRHSDGAIIDKIRKTPEFGSKTKRVEDQMKYLRQRCQWMALGIHRTDVLRKIMRLRSPADYYWGFFDVYIPFRLLGYGRPYIAKEILFHDRRHDQSQTVLWAQARASGEMPSLRITAPIRHLLQVSRAILLDPSVSRRERLRMLRRMWRARVIKRKFQIADSVSVERP